MPTLTETYGHLGQGRDTGSVLDGDVNRRFGQVLPPMPLARSVTTLADTVASSRNIPRY
ncbi:hypothetical protein Dxin01_03356 [Deinococcus xinjiangensis]|uniref:Uncharacterized protein n=1 Tax=Deinococcus xinjiangensis TaxID=457454 RepID=A0ABP9VEF1_9DEIO